MKRLTPRIAALALGIAGLCAPLPVLAADAAPAPAAPPAAPKVKPADYAARVTAATKLIDVMHMDRQLDATVPQMISLMMNALVRGNTGKEADIRAILSEEMTAAFANERPAILAVYRDVYATNLTLPEIEAMTSFYASPVGQSLVEKQAKITADTMQAGGAVGQKAAMAALPHIIQRMQAAKMAVPQGI